MAGSYQHVLDDDGELVSNERFIRRIENLGDAYEMARDMDRIIREQRAEIERLKGQGDINDST